MVVLQQNSWYLTVSLLLVVLVMTHITSLQTSCLIVQPNVYILVLQCNGFNGMNYNISFLNIIFYKKKTNSSQRNWLEIFKCLKCYESGKYGWQFFQKILFIPVTHISKFPIGYFVHLLLTIYSNFQSQKQL